MCFTLRWLNLVCSAKLWIMDQLRSTASLLYSIQLYTESFDAESLHQWFLVIKLHQESFQPLVRVNKSYLSILSTEPKHMHDLLKTTEFTLLLWRSLSSVWVQSICSSLDLQPPGAAWSPLLGSPAHKKKNHLFNIMVMFTSATTFSTYMMLWSHHLPSALSLPPWCWYRCGLGATLWQYTPCTHTLHTAGSRCGLSPGAPGTSR